MLSINYALFIHLVIFLTVVVLVAPLLIKPTMALLEERDEKIGGAKEKAKSLKEESDSRISQIEGRLADERRKAIIEREKLRSEFVKKADSILATSRKNAADQISGMRSRIAKERESARSSLRSEAQALSREIAQRILGREVA